MILGFYKNCNFFVKTFSLSSDTLQPKSLTLYCLKIKVSHNRPRWPVVGRLRPRIFLTFVATRVVGRQPYAPAAFTPGEISGTHFQRLTAHGFVGKKSPVTPPGIDPWTVQIVAQRLNHYATPGPSYGE